MSGRERDDQSALRRRVAVGSTQNDESTLVDAPFVREAVEFERQLIGVVSRETFADEMMFIRIIAVIAFSIIALLAFAFVFIIGFNSLVTQLFALSFGHFILTPIALYATLRFGIAVNVALGLAALQLIADFIQFILRVILVNFTALSLVLLLLNIVFLVLDVLYVAYLYRLRVASNRLAASVTVFAADVGALNVADALEKSTNVTLNLSVLRSLLSTPVAAEFSDAQLAALLAQENNTLRVAALFSIVAGLLLVAFVLIFLSFTNRTTLYGLFQVGHILLGAYTLLAAGRRASAWYVFIVLLALLQTALDVTSLVLRAVDDSVDNDVTTVALGPIVNLFFFIITFAFLLADGVYIVSAIGVLSLPRRALDTAPTLAPFTAAAAKAKQSAMPMARALKQVD